MSLVDIRILSWHCLGMLHASGKLRFGFSPYLISSVLSRLTCIGQGGKMIMVVQFGRQESGILTVIPTD